MSSPETKPIFCPTFQHVCGLKFPNEYDHREALREPEDICIEWLRFSISDFMISFISYENTRHAIEHSLCS